jgi:hypothetical protein
VPDGTIIKDANEIVPGARIFRYASGYGKGSPAGFSDEFRYQLLWHRGGWWVDLDVIALAPFRFTGDYVFGLARESWSASYLASGVIHAPAGSPLMGRCLEACRAATPERLQWGDIGPRLLERMVGALSLEHAIQPPPVFYPVDAHTFWRLIRRGQSVADTVAVHLWAQLWRHYGLNPDGRYPETCLYEQLIARYLPEALGEPRPRVNVGAAILRSLPKRVATGAWFLSRSMRRRLRGRKEPG